MYKKIDLVVSVFMPGVDSSRWALRMASSILVAQS